MTERVRGFEIVSGYEGRGINLPVRKTKYSAGYDFESSETVTIPSIWKKVFRFVSDIEDETGKEIDSFEEIASYVTAMLLTSSVKDVMKEFNLRPTLISTGVKSYMLEDEYLQLSNRSSGAMNRGLIMSNGVGNIDCDYYGNAGNEGLIYFQFLNFLPFDVTIEKGSAIGQGIFKKYLVSDDDSASGERKGGHGSTDEKEVTE